MHFKRFSSFTKKTKRKISHEKYAYHHVYGLKLSSRIAKYSIFSFESTWLFEWKYRKKYRKYRKKNSSSTFTKVAAILHKCLPVIFTCRWLKNVTGNLADHYAEISVITWVIILINSYWMGLSMISRIIQIEVNVICRSRRLRWITLTEVWIILHVIRKPNPIIVLLYI